MGPPLSGDLGGYDYGEQLPQSLSASAPATSIPSDMNASRYVTGYRADKNRLREEQRPVSMAPCGCLTVCPDQGILPWLPAAEHQRHRDRAD